MYTNVFVLLYKHSNSVDIFFFKSNSWKLIYYFRKRESIGHIHDMNVVYCIAMNRNFILYTVLQIPPAAPSACRWSTLLSARQCCHGKRPLTTAEVPWPDIASNISAKTRSAGNTRTKEKRSRIQSTLWRGSRRDRNMTSGKLFSIFFLFTSKHCFCIVLTVDI